MLVNGTPPSIVSDSWDVPGESRTMGSLRGCTQQPHRSPGTADPPVETDPQIITRSQFLSCHCSEVADNTH